MNTTDTIIIGEGFYGLFVGIKIAEKGYNVKIFEKKTKSLGFLDKGKPSLSKKTFTKVSNSLIPISKFSSYSLNTRPVRMMPVKI